jgi:hypothetical protein
MDLSHGNQDRCGSARSNYSLLWHHHHPVERRCILEVRGWTEAPSPFLWHQVEPPLWLVLPYHWRIVIEVFRAGWDRPLVPDSDLVVSNLLVWLDPDVI